MYLYGYNTPIHHIRTLFTYFSLFSTANRYQFFFCPTVCNTLKCNIKKKKTTQPGRPFSCRYRATGFAPCSSCYSPARQIRQRRRLPNVLWPWYRVPPNFVRSVSLTPLTAIDGHVAKTPAPACLPRPADVRILILANQFLPGTFRRTGNQERRATGWWPETGARNSIGCTLVPGPHRPERFDFRIRLDGRNRRRTVVVRNVLLSGRMHLSVVSSRVRKPFLGRSACVVLS